MNNILYITDNVGKVKEMAIQYAKDLSFFPFLLSRETVDEIKELYLNSTNTCLYIEGINPSPITDGLLKILEIESTNTIIGATTHPTIKEALRQRFEIKFLISTTETDARAFIRGKNIDKEIYSSWSFYYMLAKYIVKRPNKHLPHNLLLINSIIQDISLCTYNIPYEILFSRLKGGFIR